MMSKFIVISALFLLPFVIITSISAQFELHKYEFPSDYIITYELDEDAREPTESRLPNDQPLEGQSFWAEVRYAF